MKLAAFSLLFLPGLGVVAAQTPEALRPAKTSSRLAGEIRAGLPAFSLAAAKPVTQASAIEADPDVLVLPKFSVREKRVPTNDPDVWLTGRVVQRKAMAAYQGSMTPFEWALNSWFVPIFSAPASVRARAAYQENKLDAEYSQLNHLAEIGRQADAPGSANLKRAVQDMEQADERQNRPAGENNLGTTETSPLSPVQ